MAALGILSRERGRGKPKRHLSEGRRRRVQGTLRHNPARDPTGLANREEIGAIRLSPRLSGPQSAVFSREGMLDGADQLAVVERLLEIVVAVAVAVSVLGPGGRPRADENPGNVRPSLGRRIGGRGLVDVNDDDAGAGPGCKIPHPRGADAIDLQTARLEHRPQHFFRLGKTVDDKNALPLCHSSILHEAPSLCCRHRRVTSLPHATLSLRWPSQVFASCEDLLRHPTTGCLRA
jgi:hypothetical protein